MILFPSQRQTIYFSESWMFQVVEEIDHYFNHRLSRTLARNLDNFEIGLDSDVSFGKEKLLSGFALLILQCCVYVLT